MEDYKLRIKSEEVFSDHLNILLSMSHMSVDAKSRTYQDGNPLSLKEDPRKRVQRLTTELLEFMVDFFRLYNVHPAETMIILANLFHTSVELFLKCGADLNNKED